ncbi:MAG: dynamin family protein, partial [Thermoguttaceae bacterium]|nr:dynamin family protein [Thermoguttaceae bacterium]
LGEVNLLPTDTDVATSTVYKVMYGPWRKFKVFFLPDVDTGERPDVLEIDESQLAEYGTEDRNPNNEKRVDFIGVELPHPLLRQGLVLVDTPGVGGLHRAHRRISRQYAPNADAVFFVLDSVEAVISADEIAFLQDLYSNVTKRIFFVQTKTDMADMQQVEAWQARNKQLLAEKLDIPPEHLNYFPVSAKLKRIADERRDGIRFSQSGFLAVLDFIHRGLMAAKDRQLSSDVARRLGRFCSDQIGHVREQLSIYRQESQKELMRLQQELQGIRDKMDQWRRTVYPAQVQKFSDRFTALRRRKQQEIQELLDPSGPLVVDVIQRLRESDKSANELADLSDVFQQDWLVAAADAMRRVRHGFNQEFTVLIEDVMKETCKTLADGVDSESITSLVSGEHEIDSRDLISREKLPTRLGVFEQARSALYGGMAGMMMAKIATGVVAFVFAPLPTVGVLAALAGAAIGGALGRKELATRKREEVLARLQSVLQNLSRRCGRQFLTEFAEIADYYERHARDLFKKAADQTQDSVRQRLKQLEQVRSQTSEQSQSEAEKVQRKLEELTAIERQLRAVAASAS